MTYKCTSDELPQHIFLQYSLRSSPANFELRLYDNNIPYNLVKNNHFLVIHSNGSNVYIIYKCRGIH